MVLAVLALLLVDPHGTRLAVSSFRLAECEFGRMPDALQLLQLVDAQGCLLCTCVRTILARHGLGS